MNYPLKMNYPLLVNPVNPLSITPPRVRKEHIDLLKEWVKTRNSVWEQVKYSTYIRGPVCSSVSRSVELHADASLWKYVRDALWEPVEVPLARIVGDAVRDSVTASPGMSRYAGRWNAIRDIVWYSIRDVSYAYTGITFQPYVAQWSYTEHEEGKYPFQSAIDLWNQGLVPSFDGEIWRLHGGEDAKILWEIRTK